MAKYYGSIWLPLVTGSNHPFRFGVQISGPVSPADLIETARTMEDLGYAVFSCSDHLSQLYPQHAPLLALAAVAAVTTTIELQPLVLANDFRHPVVLAKEAATLDLLSGGRFSLGLGVGWLAADYHSTGIEFHRPGIRIERLEEAVAIFKGLQSGEPFEFQGKHFGVSNLAGTPAPDRTPIPLLVAGSGRRLLSLAARIADTVALNPGLPFSSGNWQTGPTPYADVTDQKLEWIRGAAGGRFGALEIQSTVLAGGITQRDPESLLTPVATLLGVPVGQLAGSPHVLAGTVEQCIETVLGWRERWGISYISFPAAIARDMAPVVRALQGT
jgi:probable F420-dependent oxidoreductase